MEGEGEGGKKTRQNLPTDLDNKNNSVFFSQRSEIGGGSKNLASGEKGFKEEILF